MGYYHSGEIIVYLFFAQSIQTTASRRELDVFVEPNVRPSNNDGIVGHAGLCCVLRHQGPHHRQRPVSPKHVPGDRGAEAKNMCEPKQNTAK